MQYQTTRRWLQAASAIVIGFGLLGVATSHPVLSGPERIFIDMAIWPIDGLPDNPTPESRLLWAIVNGVLIGWGVLLWLITTRLLPSDPPLARTMILTSIWTWFVIDSVGSIAAGAPMNAVFNIGFLLLFVIPLWQPLRQLDAH